MSSKKHLLIGSSSAALSALEKIRAIAPEDEIKLVTMEEHPPYSPASLPYLLSGRITEKELPLKDEGYFENLKANLASGKEVIQVLPQKKEVVYEDGSSEGYDTLLIATGSEPTKVAIEGLEKIGFVGFHTLADCRKLLEELENKNSVVIYGGGLIAIELAASLLEKGCQVKIIVRSRILRRYFDQDAGDIIEDILGSEGAEIFSGAEISQVRRKGNGMEITLSSGAVLNADLFINAVGVQPRVSLLKESGILIDQGVLVDRRMRTNIDDVYAAGDIAQAPDFFTGQAAMNPLLPSAVVQGKIAGSNMAGQEVEYEGDIPMNIFQLFGHTAFSIGQAVFTESDAQILKNIDTATKSFRKLVFQQGRLVGAMFLDGDADPGMLHYLIRKKTQVSPHEELLLERTKDTARWLMLRAEKQESILSEV
jgi:phenylglyoxylate dehydrogenase epsilon subunit